jgi:hypothetical protein
MCRSVFSIVCIGRISIEIASKLMNRNNEIRHTLWGILS